ncbi:conserved hypothetical protein [Actinacidiphila cocklensis]|uniref:Uncharacterized protein n=2 Tax=Actinacidiphila cocklensis TaxID=887465 RepID=A0A9W4DXT9_9ACTN|nr:conserved hypothetical protein [Actinacidiphila cocklensis]
MRMRWRSVLPVQMVILPVAVLELIFGPFGRDTPLTAFVGGTMASGLLIWIRAFRLRSLGCVLRIDAAGVTVAGAPAVPWERLRRVELARRRVVVFLPRIPEEGDPLPLVPDGFIQGARGRRRLHDTLVDRYGSPMVLFTAMYGVSPREVLDAVRYYSGGEAVSD